MSAELRTAPEAIDVQIAGVEVARYATGSDVAATDVSKPHFHPLRTLAGVEITGHAPDDHPWHHGLQFAFPRVDGHNLWGGGTFHDLERGYEVIDDHGSMSHQGWGEADAADDAARIVERVAWRGHDGEELLDEMRSWTLAEVVVDAARAYRIDLDTTLSSGSSAPTTLSTPAGRGRPDGGYGGLFLRLAEGFAAERLAGDDGPVASSGARSRTLVVHGWNADRAAVTLGLSFLDPDGPGTQSWLYRFSPFAAIGWAHAYEADLTIPPHGAQRFRHRLVVADGHLDVEAVQGVL